MSAAPLAGILRVGATAWRRADSRAARLPLWPTLALVSTVVLLVQLPGTHATAWHFFHDSSRLLIGDGPPGEVGGLHLYGDHPEFQFGPLSIGLAVPFSLMGYTVGSWAAMLVASVAGLIAFALVLDTIERLRPGFRAQVRPLVLLASGTAAIVTWGDVAVRTAHIDDAIALVAITTAMRCCAGGESRPCVVALAVAAAAKPWAIMFAPLALLPVADPCVAGLRWVGRWLAANRAGVVRVARVGILALLGWAPFVVAEPHTLDVTDFGIPNDPTSVLRAFGISDPMTPSWVRPAQLLGGIAIVGLVVVRGWWPSALLAGTAWRLLLDPGAHRYYTIGFVLGALIVELIARRNRVPWGTIAAALVLEITAVPGIPEVSGRTLRLICVVAGLAAVGLVSSVYRPRQAAGTGALDQDVPSSRTSVGTSSPAGSTDR